MEIVERLSKGPKGKSHEIDDGRNREGKGHLNLGVRPIIACVGTPQDFAMEGPGGWESIGNGVAQNIDYFNYPEKLNADGHKSPSQKTYVISELSNKDKRSYGFRNCTGVVVAGKRKSTGENVSIMTHQDPNRFLGEWREQFLNDLRESFMELKEACEEGTIDAVVFGGNSSKSKKVVRPIT